MRKTLFQFALAATMALGSASLANAAAVVFGQSPQVNGSATPFSFNNATGVFSATDVPVVYLYDSTVFDGTGANSSVTAGILNLTVSSNQNAIDDGAPGGTIVQPLNLLGSFSIINGGTNLLSGTLTGRLTGLAGSGTVGQDSSTAVFDVVTFTSDLPAFFTTGSTLRTIRIALNGADPTSTPTIGANGQFNSFSASGTGNFAISFDPDDQIPEPSTYALLGSGLVVLVAMRRRYGR